MRSVFFFCFVISLSDLLIDFFFPFKVDAFLEAHDSGLTDADKKVADGELLCFFFETL